MPAKFLSSMPTIKLICTALFHISSRAAWNENETRARLFNTATPYMDELEMFEGRAIRYANSRVALSISVEPRNLF